MIVVGQPLSGGGEFLVAATVGCEGAAGLEQKSGVLGQSSVKAGAPGVVQCDWLGGGEAPRMLLKALDSE